MKYAINDAKSDLDKIPLEIRLKDRMLKASSIITKLMSYHVKDSDMPIIVGGLSLEIYTDGEYTTHDVDFVTSASILMHEKLLEIGFEKSGRMFHHNRLNIAVDIVDSVLVPESYDKVNKIEISNDYFVLVQSIESILYDRALDYDRVDSKKYGLYLLSTNYNKIDIDFIKDELSDADPDALEAFNSWINIVTGNKNH